MYGADKFTSFIDTKFNQGLQKHMQDDTVFKYHLKVKKKIPNNLLNL